jgi:diguanylate cyclase (GGDEF)-like protein
MVLMKRVERPLRYLLKGTEIIQNGEYGFQIERAYFRKAPVELQLLCEAYNDMSSKLRANVQLLQQTSLIDQLTEAYNRRFIMHEGSRLLESSLAAGKICSVVMADIDFFKSINDTYGHVVGDRVLRYFSDKLKLTNGPAGEVIVARYGGEEFLMLLIGFDVSAARKVAEWSRTMLEGSPYRDGELTVAITASFGISSYKGMREFGTTILEDLIARADHALYEAKRLGRNRTVVYGGNLETDAERQREIR